MELNAPETLRVKLQRILTEWSIYAYFFKIFACVRAQCMGGWGLKPLASGVEEEKKPVTLWSWALDAGLDPSLENPLLSIRRPPPLSSSPPSTPPLLCLASCRHRSAQVRKNPLSTAAFAREPSRYHRSRTNCTLLAFFFFFCQGSAARVQSATACMLGVSVQVCKVHVPLADGGTADRDWSRSLQGRVMSCLTTWGVAFMIFFLRVWTNALLQRKHHKTIRLIYG